MTPKQCSVFRDVTVQYLSGGPSFNAKCVAEQFLGLMYEARHQDPPSLHFGLKNGEAFVNFCLEVYKGKFLKAKSRR